MEVVRTPFRARWHLDRSFWRHAQRWLHAQPVHPRRLALQWRACVRVGVTYGDGAVTGVSRELCGWSVSQPVATYAAIIAGSVFSCAIFILALRLPDEQVASTAADEVRGRSHGQLQRMNHIVAAVITEAVSSMVGWLENGLDFHLSKHEEGVEGKSLVPVLNVSLKAALASSTEALGMRGCLARAYPGH